MLVDKIEVKFCLFDRDDLAEPPFKWHVYVTGHSLGGALATLLALELSSSQLAKWVLYLSTYEVILFHSSVHYIKYVRACLYMQKFGWERLTIQCFWRVLMFP